MKKITIFVIMLCVSFTGFSGISSARHWREHTEWKVYYTRDITTLMGMREEAFVRVFVGWTKSFPDDLKKLEESGASKAEAEKALYERLDRSQTLIDSGFRAPEDISPALDRLENKLYIINNIARLGHGRLSSVMTALEMGEKTNLMGCLCAGGFAIGVGGGFNPAPSGDCQNDLPCKGGNWGCVAFDFPNKPKLWSLCDAQEDESVVGEILVGTLKNAFRKSDRKLSAAEREKLSVRQKCERKVVALSIVLHPSGLSRSELEGWKALCVGLEQDSEPIFQYGNWYGPGFWGGFRHPDRAGPKAPVDSLDEIAMYHDFGYLLAQQYGEMFGKKYGLIVGKSVEYQLRAIADAIAVRDSKRLPADPELWPLRPKTAEDVEKAKRYRARIITGFAIETEVYDGVSRLAQSRLPIPPGEEGRKVFQETVEKLVQNWRRNGEGKNQAFFEAFAAEQAEKERQRGLKEATETNRLKPRPGQTSNPSDLIVKPAVPALK